MKIRPDTTKLIVLFRNFATAPKHNWGGGRRKEEARG